MMVADELVENGACKVDMDKLLRTALIHDLEELTTSDIPSHVKHSSKEVYDVFSKMQRQAFSETIEGLPRKYRLKYEKLYEEQKGDGPEGRILALVDKFDMIIYCFQEVQLGNNYFIPMLQKAIKLTKAMQYYEQSSFINRTVTEIEMVQTRATGNGFQGTELLMKLGLNVNDYYIITADVWNKINKPIAGLPHILSRTSFGQFISKYWLFGVRFLVISAPSQYGLDQTAMLDFLDENIEEFERFKVDASMKKYDADNMIVQGEFMMSEGDDYLTGVYNIEKDHSLKEINMIGKPLEGIAKHWWAFRRIKDIMMLHRLYDVVVELSLYNCKVGLWGDEYICWELRNIY